MPTATETRQINFALRRVTKQIAQTNLAYQEAKEAYEYDTIVKKSLEYVVRENSLDLQSNLLAATEAPVVAAREVKRSQKVSQLKSQSIRLALYRDALEAFNDSGE